MSNYLDFGIKTRNQFKEWIVTMLGEPLITVEVHETQLDAAIDNAVEEYTRMANQDTNFLAIPLTAYESPPTSATLDEITLSGQWGFLLPKNVTGIFTFDDQYVFTGNAADVNTLFSIPNMMWNAGLIPNFALGKGGGWITYELAMQSLKLTKRMTGRGFQFEFNPRTHRLLLFPDPIKENIGGMIVLGCYTIRPDEYQYGEQWVKRMALAQTKIILGTVRGKFSGVQILGGGNINADIKDEGVAERDALREELLTHENGAWGFFIG